MRAAVYRRYGGPEVVSVEIVPRPRPGPGEVLLRVHASTVSSGDARVRSLRVPTGFGLLSRAALGFFGPRKPVLGTELAGEVVALGDGVTDYALGERVAAYPGVALGCHAEYRTMPVKGNIARLPDSISFEQGAALAFGGTAALHFLRDAAKLQSGERVLVIGASGAVGAAAVQLAKHFGASVTGVTSTANVELVRGLGADRVVDYAREPLFGAGDAYDVIFEAVGVHAYAECRAGLANGGRLILCAGSVPQILGSLVRTIGTTHRVLAGGAPERPADLALLVSLAEAGRYAPPIDRTYPLERITEAHAYVDTGRKRGNVVVTMG
ncbi:MAG: NAD(P)-dependent alcohol dehydrogenase [Deltaproteobacteria bacterium]|nr:NAD(P)-dependent alcohol dehydrogenase [Deltaproteobacteria bacterium]